MTDNCSTDTLKDILVKGGGGVFHRKPSQKAGATYDVLYCKLRSDSLFALLNSELRMNILTPGIRHIPVVPAANLLRPVVDTTITVAPFFALLFLKLDCWSSRGRSDRQHIRNMQGREKQLVDALVRFGQIKGEKLADSEQWMPPEFLEMGRALAREFIAVHGAKKAWEALGVTLQDPTPIEGTVRQAFIRSDI